MLYRRGVLFTWLAIVAASAWWTARHGVVTTDLTAFLPVASGRLERLLVEQLRSGVASRTMLVAIEGGAPSELARFSRELARAIAPDRRFDYVMNGGAEFTRGARELGLKHRYLLSPTVSAERFSEQSLARALRENLARFATLEGTAFKARRTNCAASPRPWVRARPPLGTASGFRETALARSSLRRPRPPEWMPCASRRRPTPWRTPFD